MQIRIRETGAVVYDREFRAMFPNTGFPVQLTEEIINDFGGDVVFEGPQATGGTVYQYSQAAGVEEIDGKWYTKYILGPVFTDRPATDTEPAKTAAEQEAAYKATKDAEQAKSVRATRGEKLKDSDWTQVADAPVDQAAWAAYRQALRDITSQEGFPWTVEWPTQPE
jgi:hypothetical protein